LAKLYEKLEKKEIYLFHNGLSVHKTKIATDYIEKTLK
jgi:hypothetical protein